MVSVEVNLIIESGTWLFFVLLTMALRMSVENAQYGESKWTYFSSASRLLSKAGWRELHFDDWLMLFLTLTYTAVLVILNHLAYKEHVISQEGQTVPVQILVGKLWTAAELLMMFTVWGVKICLLLLYSRLTMVSRELIMNIFIVRAVGVYVVATYVVVLVVFCTTLCKPFNTFWAPVAEQPESCWIWTKYYIIHYVFNASSDLMIICIPITVVIRARFNLARKLLLVGIFGIGILTIVAATLNKYYNFVEPTASGKFIPWYVREESMALLVANLVLCRPALRYMFSWHIFQAWPHTRPKTEDSIMLSSSYLVLESTDSGSRITRSQV